MNRRRPASPWLVIAGLVAAVLVGFVGYNVTSLRSARSGGGDGSVAVATTTPAATAAPSPAPSSERESPALARSAAAKAKPVHRTVSLRLTQPCWLLVKVDGAKLLEGTYPAGTRKSFVGKIANIRAGNAGGVELTVNGRALGAMGHSGAVVERTIALVGG